METLEQKKHQPTSQTARILALFKLHGELTNHQLNRVCFRYSARIADLRSEGHVIVAVHEKGSLWRFCYKGRMALGTNTVEIPA